MSDQQVDAMERMERFYAMWEKHLQTRLSRTQKEADRIAVACGVTAPRIPILIRIPRRGRKK